MLIEDYGKRESDDRSLRVFQKYDSDEGLGKRNILKKNAAGDGGVEL